MIFGVLRVDHLVRSIRWKQVTFSTQGASKGIEVSVLNTFACSSNEEEDSGDDEDLEFDDSTSAIPIGIVQKSKLALQGGMKSNTSREFMRNGGTVSHRSKRAEQKFKETHMIFDGPVRVRVMDVDAFNLAELHHYFMHTLVRRFPAEQCVRVASRIALFRDKNTQHSFESMSNDVASIFGPVYGPELTAMFSRCYSTIPIAFMLDYTRRFGKFSRKYLAMQIDKNMNPRYFDFIRYESNGGVRPLPGIISRPFSLRSFAWLLPPCSAKKYIFQHLLAKSGKEVNTDNTLTALEAGSLDPQIKHDAQFSEKLVSSWKRVPRPSPPLIDKLMSETHSGQPISADDIITALEGDISGKFVESIESKHGMGSSNADTFYNLQTIPVHPFKTPLFDENTDALALVNMEGFEHTQLARSSLDDEEENSSWWRSRQTSDKFFRHNKKSYRLVDGSWKQVEDPRGEVPDYAREMALRNSKRKLRLNYDRLARQKARKASVARSVKKLLDS